MASFDFSEFDDIPPFDVEPSPPIGWGEFTESFDPPDGRRVWYGYVGYSDEMMARLKALVRCNQLRSIILLREKSSTGEPIILIHFSIFHTISRRQLRTQLALPVEVIVAPERNLIGKRTNTGATIQIMLGAAGEIGRPSRSPEDLWRYHFAAGETTSTSGRIYTLGVKKTQLLAKIADELGDLNEKQLEAILVEIRKCGEEVSAEEMKRVRVPKKNTRVEPVSGAVREGPSRRGAPKVELPPEDLDFLY